MVAADIEESEEDKSILELCNTLDGSLIETQELLRAACEYRQFCIEMNHMEAEFLSRYLRQKFTTLCFGESENLVRVPQ